MTESPKKGLFTDRFEAWLESKEPKTVLTLGELFAEKSFAAIILLLMALPALPLPTGGVSHLFELIAMLLTLELIMGLKTIWLPRRWRNKGLDSIVKAKAARLLMRRLRWLETHSSSRLQMIFTWPFIMRAVGIILFVLTLGAFLSPPFSGLDTLPSMGVVIICAGIITDDALLLAAGTVVGAAGIALSIGLGAAAFNLLHHIF